MNAVIQKPLIEQAHAPYPKLVVRAGKIHGTPRRRIEPDVPNWRAQTILRQRKVFQRPPDEDSSRVNCLIETGLSIDKQNAEAPLRQQPRRLQTSEAGTNDDYVKSLHLPSWVRAESSSFYEAGCFRDQ